jgi:lysophospholipase L1-like esterase
MSAKSLARSLALFLALSPAACNGVPAAYPDPLPVTPTTEAPVLPPPTSDDPLPPPPPIEPVGAPYASKTPELARFHAALNELERRRSKRHVRILWLGDSHGQADFWSGQVRKQLQARFGNAGPGFLHLGYKNYRHDGIKLDIQGKWRMRPKKPVGVSKQDDGVFGLGGLLMSGYDDNPRVELTLNEPLPGATAHYDLCYRLVQQGDAIAYAIDGAKETLASAGGPLGGLTHVALQGKPAGPLVVRPIGRTDLCGVILETDPDTQPGVVVDTLAINGARYGTMLAWDETAWVMEVERRAPDLVILELGTNEAGDGTPAYNKVSGQVGELLGRVRKAGKNVDCVVVSSTDRADAETRTTKMRATLKEAAKREGCFWFDAWELLGGEGAMAKLREEPEPRVQPDGIHLTIKGYRALGGQMVDALLKGY